jgi:peptide-methionine (S)-S-oxide reductase
MTRRSALTSPAFPAAWLLVLATAGCALPSAAAGPGPSLPPPALDVPQASGPQTAVFAAGCFWCVEAVFEAVKGVDAVVSGYAGDGPGNAKYEIVGVGLTKHAEAVQVTYDPAQVTYGQLLQILFSTSDPTTKNGQPPDWGTQYRSTVFYRTDDEKKVAEAYLRQLDAAKLYPAPLAVTLEKLTEFYPAEAYHQDFVRLHPNHPYVRAWSVARVTQLLKKLPERVKPSTP